MFKVPRLEQALCEVEDMAFKSNAIWQMLYNLKKTNGVPPTGLAKNYRGFRNYLLHIKDTGLRNDFHISPEFLLPTVFDDYFGALTGIHIDIANWMAKSRRVYNLSHAMAMQLALTPVDNVRWRDVRFPFDAFAVQLEQPITTRSGKVFDFILVAKFDVNGQESLVIDLISPAIAVLPRLSSNDRKLMMRFVKRGEYARLIKKINTQIRVGKKRISNTTINSRVLVLTEIMANQPIYKSIATLGNISNASLDELRHAPRPYADPQLFSEWDEAANIVCGLCLYLENLHGYSTSYGQSTTQTVPTDNSVIDSIEDICSVTNEVTLSPREMNIIENSGGRPWEMSTHFRRGHWRKISSEKTIWIRPALVRADRLQEGNLPGGAIHKMI